MLYSIHQDELCKEKYPGKTNDFEYHYRYMVFCFGIITYSFGFIIFLTIGYTLKEVFLPSSHTLLLNSVVEP